MRSPSSLPRAAVVLALTSFAACVGSDPEPTPSDPTTGSSGGSDGGAGSSSSSSSSSSGGASSGGASSGAGSSSGTASSSGTPSDAGPGTYTVGAARLHWSLLDGSGGPLRCDSSGGQTIQGEATPLGAGGNNVQNAACDPAATEGVVVVGNLPLDGFYTVSVSLYAHEDPKDDPSPISYSSVQDLSFPDGGGCDEIAGGACIVDFAANIVVPHP